jgi:hypothetical protein
MGGGKEPVAKIPEYKAPDGSMWPNKGAYDASVIAKQEAARVAKLETDRLAAAKVEADKASKLREGYQEMALGVVDDPSSLVTSTNIDPLKVTAEQTIDQSVGQAGDAKTATNAAAGVSDKVLNPATIGTATMGTSSATPQVQSLMDQLTGAEGEVKPEALAAAIIKDPSQLSQLGLSPEQITQITQVISPDKLEVSEEMFVAGSAVDMAKVEEIAQIEAAQADPSIKATVVGQLDQLYQDFEGGETPAWASGAMRGATAKMAARGLAASSMAGQAIVQAAMESALPIAMADAQTYASFESQNLSNRQQAAILGAQQRADFLKMDFDQSFQTRVVNAARVADVAQINFTAEQQVALENSRLTQTANLSNLNAVNAKVMSDAAAMSQLDLANLSNQQRVAVENAKSFLQMDLTNLANQQQTQVFKAQALQQTLLSDTAATNAAAQFNAASENQTTQFMSTMTAQVSQFNVAQANAMEQFNVNEENAVEKFNTEQDNMRDQFNTQNSLIIAQSNAKWRQDVATINTTTQNEANMEDAKTANAFTAKALDEMWQRERDLMQYAFVGSESAQERALELTLQGKKSQAESSAAKGAILAKVLFGGML